MSTARTRTHAALTSAAILVCALVAALACTVNVQAAYADFAVSELAAQADSSSTESSLPKPLQASMVSSFMETNPAPGGTTSYPTMVDGSKTLTRLTDYSSVTSGTFAVAKDKEETDAGRTTTITGTNTYSGKIVINYKAVIDSETSPDMKAEYVSIRYSASGGFGVGINDQGEDAGIKGNVTVPSAAKVVIDKFGSASGNLEITGKGSLAGQSIKVVYTVTVSREISEAMVTVTPKNGKITKDSIVVKDAMGTLTAGADYELADLTPEGVDDAGEPYLVSITGKDPCNGTVSYYCIVNDNGNVEKKSYLLDATLTLSQDVFLYEEGMAAPKPDVIVKSGTTLLVEKTDFEVTRPAESTEIGEYEITVKGIGDWRGKATIPYKIEKAEPLVYTVTSTDQETGEEVKTRYDCAVDLSSIDYTYNGAVLKPTFGTSSSANSKVTYQTKDEEGAVKETKTLTENTDFTVEICPDPGTSNTQAGTYYVTIRGKGNCTGVAQEKYVVKQYDWGLGTTKPYVSLTYYKSVDGATKYIGSSSTKFYYAGGNEVKPPISTSYISLSGTKYLTEGIDYELIYKRNKEVADEAATDAETGDMTAPAIGLVGKGNYKGTYYKYFSIIECPLTSTYVELKYDGTYTYTGKALKPKPTSVRLKVADGEKAYTLKEGVDYIIDSSSYANNTDAGTATAGIKAKTGSNFSSSTSLTANFTIGAKSIKKSDITVSSITSKAYTGSALTPAPTVKDKGTGKTLKVGTLSTYYTYDSASQSYKPFQQLASGYDYYLEYSKNINPGTATVKITGGNNYTGSRTVKFAIKGTGTIPKVKATNQGGGVVLLKWSPIYNAAKYRVLEKQTNGSYKTLSNNVTSTACRISNLSSTRTHRFLVQAYVNKKWSSKSDVYLAKCKPTGATKPTIRAQSYSNSAILVSWAQVPGASAYALYEKVGKKYQLRSDSYQYTSVRFTNLKKKKSYTYYVRAKIDGKWYKASNKVTFSPADPNSPVPTAAAVAGKKGQIKLTWSKPRNATKYMVQVLKGKTWKTLTKNCKALTYTAKGLAAKKQTFRVRAYGNGKWSKIYTDYYATATPDNA